MKKSDLKSGMIVEYKNGIRRLVIGDNLTGNDGCNHLKYYDNDLKNMSIDKLDIVKVFNLRHPATIDRLLLSVNLELIWERKKDKNIDKYENIGDLGFVDACKTAVDVMIKVVVDQVVKDLQPILDLLPECKGDDDE